MCTLIVFGAVIAWGGSIKNCGTSFGMPKWVRFVVGAVAESVEEEIGV